MNESNIVSLLSSVSRKLSLSTCAVAFSCGFAASSAQDLPALTDKTPLTDAPLLDTASTHPGSVDVEFDPNFGVSSGDESITPAVFALALQPDGKVIVGGQFTHFNGSPRMNLARVNPDGSLDTNFAGLSFQTSDAWPSSRTYVNSIIVRPDERVLIAGQFTSINGRPRNRIALLNPDGTLDARFFQPREGVIYDDPVLKPYVNSMTLQNDGKILIAGFFTRVGLASRVGMARLNSDGSLDTSFDPGSGVGYDIFFPRVDRVILQPDGKILIGGLFTKFNGIPRRGIARLNTNGSVDTTFEPAPIDPRLPGPNVYGLWALQPDGKVLSQRSDGVVRLNADGSRDFFFNWPPEPDQVISALTVQRDGKILVAGPFTTIYGEPKNHIARLHNSGDLDTGFDAGSGISGRFIFTTNAAVYAFLEMPDGKILIGGQFTSVDGKFRQGIARLYGIETPLPPAPKLLNPALLGSNVFRLSFPTIRRRNYLVEYKNSLADSYWTPLTLVHGDGTVKNVNHLSSPAAQRFYRVRIE